MRVFRMPLYQYFTENPDIGALFDRTMASYARYRLGRTIAAYDFSRFVMIVDVGGGNGALLISVLRTYPQPRGIVFDLTAVAERARHNIEAAGLTNRCIAIGGNALETVPTGGDAYILSNFLIDLDDDRAVRILRHCREAIADRGRLLLIESVMPTVDEPPDPNTFWDTASIDLIMLAIGGSRGGRGFVRRENFGRCWKQPVLLLSRSFRRELWSKFSRRYLERAVPTSMSPKKAWPTPVDWCG
jgi:O-methyltransferase domain